MSALSPSERFAQSRQLAKAPYLTEFRAAQSFELDTFQIDACTSVEAGRSVLVAAPTGAGKTVVAEFAVHLVMSQLATKIFYTTPIKALSNEKFLELSDRWGAENVGLLTGDTSVNSAARIVVMTTEVLRNMLYANSSTLDGLEFVILDEVHYLGDKFRGAVWEEVIIHLPEHVRLVSLSATVSNAEEFGDWLDAIRGDTDVIVSEDRPVPLEQHVYFRNELHELFEPGQDSLRSKWNVNHHLAQLVSHNLRNAQISRHASNKGKRHGAYKRVGENAEAFTRNNRTQGRSQSGFGGGRGNYYRVDLIEQLATANLLPAIVFIFSRKGCDLAMAQVLRAKLQLTDEQEQQRIAEIVDAGIVGLSDDELYVLEFDAWRAGLLQGVAAHHAGMLPIFKEIVEELFRARLVKVVLATETLALGVNMPARTVVLEKLDKYNGETHVSITPGEYTQLTGRAGRRGIDVLGHSVINWGHDYSLESVASLASRRSYPLYSSFRPTYNMAVNLIERFGRERTREILELSFAQFQADRAVVNLANTARQQRASLDGFREAMSCHLGDFEEFIDLRRTIGDLERQASKPAVSHSQQQSLQGELANLRSVLRLHPCQGCSDREKHARWAERWWKLAKDNESLEKQIRSRTGQVARQFDRVTEVLEALGYLTFETENMLTVSDSGRILKRIYGERDLLVAECLSQGHWSNLNEANLAAMAACLVYEPRRDSRGAEVNWPGRGFSSAFDDTLVTWQRLEDLEREHRLPGTEPPSPALAYAMHAWASGKRLSTVIEGTELAVGDFVRVAKQVIDLLDQISLVAESGLAVRARAAIDHIRRGVVAYGFA